MKQDTIYIKDLDAANGLIRDMRQEIKEQRERINALKRETTRRDRASQHRD